MTPVAVCEHVLHANGIHELIVHDSGKVGAEAYFAQLEMLYMGRTDASPMLPILLNLAVASLPINYMIQRGREINAQYPQVGQLRTAIVTNNSVEARIADSLVRAVRFRSNRIRFFDVSHQADAIEWLLRAG